MIKPLTSLRFFFAVIVFLSHLNLMGIHNASFSFLFETVFKEGYLGVSFFFILSGFILALNYKHKFANQTITKQNFWIARFARIYPLHLLTLVLALPLQMNEFSSDTLGSIQKTLFNITLTQSFVPGYETYYFLNAAAWSISDEFFFYLCFPFILFFFREYVFSRKFVLGLILIFPALVWFIPDNHVLDLVYINPFFRVLDFSIGILLFQLFQSRYVQSKRDSIQSTTWIELCALGLFAVFVVFHSDVPQVFRYSVYYWIPMSVIIFVFGLAKGKLSSWLSHPVMVLLGEISFGFYLFHLIVIRVFAYYGAGSLQLNVVIIVALAFIIICFISYISFRYFETPIAKMIKNRLHFTPVK